MTSVTLRSSLSCSKGDESTTSNIQELIQKLHSGLEVSKTYIPFLNRLFQLLRKNKNLNLQASGYSACIS